MDRRRFLALALPGIMILASSAESFASRRAKPLILVIGSYNPEYPWQASWRRGLEEVLGAKADLVYTDMDTKRLPPERHAAMADAAWEEYTRLSPDMVILGDDAAFKYLGPRIAGTSTPCVFLGVNANPRDYGFSAPNITGVLERPLFMRNILFIKQIMGPGFRRGLLLFDTDITSSVVHGDPFQWRGSMVMADIELDLKQIGIFDEWKRTVLGAAAQGYDVILLGLYQTLFDADGNHVDPEAVLRWTSEHAPLPMFCFWDFSVGPQGAIGGLVLFGEVQGRLAGEMALRILEGAPPASIYPKAAEKGQFLFSRSQLARWGLKLPPDIAREAGMTP